VLHPDAHAHREATDELAELMKAMPDASPKLKSALGKWPGLFARLAVVFHLGDLADAELRGDDGAADPWEVLPATAGRVAAYMRDVVLPHLLRADAVMYLTPQTGHARWIAGHILAHGLQRVTKRDVVRSYGLLKPIEKQAEIGAVMESLVTMGWLASEATSSTLRRPGGYGECEAHAPSRPSLRTKRPAAAAIRAIIVAQRSPSQSRRIEPLIPHVVFSAHRSRVPDARRRSVELARQASHADR